MIVDLKVSMDSIVVVESIRRKNSITSLKVDKKYLDYLDPE